MWLQFSVMPRKGQAPRVMCSQLGPLDMRPHGSGGLDKANVALYRVSAHTLHPNTRARAQCPQGNEVTGRRSIGLDMNLARRLIAAARRDHKARPAFALNHDAKALQQVQRDLDIGFRDQLAQHFNDHGLIFCGQWQRHQQSGQELARYIAPNRDGGLDVDPGRGDAQRREAVLAQILNLTAQGP